MSQRGIFGPPPPTQPQPLAPGYQAAPSQSPLSALMAGDLLPEMAKDDPSYQGGMGSMNASSQPHLAMKYGVVRNGKFMAPQQLQSGKPGLSQKTQEGLKVLKDLQDQAEQVAQSQDDKKAVEEAGESIGGAAAKIAGGTEKPVTSEERKEFEKAMRNLDDFDMNTFAEMTMKDILNNDEQRQLVEERLDPLDLDEYIMTGRVRQTVPIIPGKYEPVFQSYNQEEDLALKRLLVLERKNFTDAPNRYFLDKYSVMGVALGLSRLNRNILPDHLDKEGNFDDGMFWKKFNLTVKLGFHLVASLAVHFYWFDIRVRKLVQAKRLGNG